MNPFFIDKEQQNVYSYPIKQQKGGTRMYDVFISYSSQNRAQALQICDVLEKNGFVCWIDRSGIRGGKDYAEVIPKAIKSSRCFLLLLTRDAQKSDWVRKELDQAVNSRLPIYPFALESVKLDDKFEFLLSHCQWYEAYQNVPKALTELIRDLSDELKKGISIPILGEIRLPKKNRLPLILGGLAVVVAVIAAVLLLGGGPRDGDYVIWNPEYAVALSGDPIHTYYHAGETVLSQGDTLSHYSAKCVWELDFDGDTFTISRGGETLGVEPGQRGIGLGGDFTADQWELVEAGDGLYYIRNAETGFYLEWYDQKDNWATHDDVNADNRELFLVRIDPAK